MRKIYFILLMLIASISMLAAPSAEQKTLKGYVIDERDKAPLVGVRIYIPELTEGVVTDIDGKYQFENLPNRIVTVQVSYIGHQTIIKTVNLTTTTEVNFSLSESNALLDEVVVTGFSGKTLLKDSSTPVSFVNTEKLMHSSSTNIIDALSKEPGVAQITTGSGISKPIIRGLGFNRLVVVNDGIRQEGNQWGTEHGIEIDAQDVSSVEILKGPASLMYGSDALAGVLIFHGDPVAGRNTMNANVSAEYQTNNGLFAYSANFKGNQNGLVWDGRWSQKLAHNYKNKYDNYIVGTQFRENAANMMLGINKQWGYSHLILSYYHLTPGITEGDRSNDYTYCKTLPFQQIRHYKAVNDNVFYIGKGTLHTLLGYQQNRRQEFEESPTEPGLDMQLHTINYDLKYILPENNNWKFVTGINGMFQHNKNHGEEVLIPNYCLFDIGVYGTTKYTINKWTLEGGLRFDNRHLNSFALEETFEKFSRNFSSLSGSIGAVYAIGERMNVRMNLASGFRAPNLGELASNGVHEGTQNYEKGNKDLKSEHSWQIDTGWDYMSKVFTAQISLFANFIENYIFDHKLTGIKTDGYDTFQYDQGNARLLGGEIMVDIHPITALHFQNTFSYVNSVQLHQPEESKYLPWTPAPRWTSELKYDFIRDGKKMLNNTFALISLECNLRQNHFYAAEGTETATPSYTLVNLAVGTDLRTKYRRWGTVNLTANNIFDRAYQNHLSRLKYVGDEAYNGRMGLFNMGRNFGAKMVIYLF